MNHSLYLSLYWPHTLVPQIKQLKTTEQIQCALFPCSAFSFHTGLKRKASMSKAGCLPSYGCLAAYKQFGSNFKVSEFLLSCSCFQSLILKTSYWLPLKWTMTLFKPTVLLPFVLTFTSSSSLMLCPVLRSWITHFFSNAQYKFWGTRKLSKNVGLRFSEVFSV